MKEVPEMIRKAPAGMLAALIFASAAAAQTAAIGIEDNVNRAVKLVKQTKPLYPPEAKAARLSGIVKLEAAIGKDGKIQTLQIKSGHPLLAAAAYDAVLLWEYTPAQKDGQPVEAVATIDVNFSLADDGPPAMEVPGSTQLGRLVNKVTPAYPADAKQQGVSGKVRLHVAIGADGAVQAIRVLEGDPALVPAAVDAVRQWQYEPAVVDGAPVAVATDIDVNFTLSPQ
jgi:TonB family protein